MFSSNVVSFVLSLASFVGGVYANNDSLNLARKDGMVNDRLFANTKEDGESHRELHTGYYNWEGNDIVDVTLHRGLETFITALIIAGYEDDLECNKYYWYNCEHFSTVFAPTDAAFSEHGVDDVVALYTTDSNYLLHLRSLLKYHIIDREVSSQNILNGARLDTLQGEPLSAALYFGYDIQIENAEVVETDLWAKNGIIHIIDSVLLPSFVTNNIVEVAASTGDFETLIAAAESAGLVDFLTDDKNPVTLFAPTDDAFASIASTVESLSIEELAEVLKYHVVQGAIVNSGQLEDGQEIKTVQGDIIDVNIAANHGLSSMEMFFLNDATIVSADILGSNGIIHVIDHVLIPPSLSSKPANSADKSSGNSDRKKKGTGFFP